jgi:hypothetical protein
MHLARGFHPRKAADKLAEDFRRVLRVGNYWYWLEASELANGIDIASLVCPLRYDVVVRRDFLSFYAAHEDLYSSDFDAFANLVRQSSYYTWYARSDTVRSRPHLLDDPDGLWLRFVDKIHRVIDLYRSMMKAGYDERHPIVLKTAENLIPPTADRRAPPTGKFISDRYFMADGCHRLAFLMMMGHTVLPAEYFRVKCFREFSPFDSTSLLAPSLPLGASQYFTFLSSRYCHPLVFEDRESFLGYVAEHSPELLQEVLSFIRVDGFDPEVPSRETESAESVPSSGEEQSDH